MKRFFRKLALGMVMLAAMNQMMVQRATAAPIGSDDPITPVAAPIGTDPPIGFSFSDSEGDKGFGTLFTIPNGNATYWATSGSLTLTATSDATNLPLGTYSLETGIGPGVTLSNGGGFDVDNMAYPTGNGSILLDYWGLVFSGHGIEINIWGNGSPDNYSLWTSPGGADWPVERSDVTYLDGAPQPVPEPSSFALAGLGGIVLLILTRRRRLQAITVK